VAYFRREAREAVRIGLIDSALGWSVEDFHARTRRFAERIANDGLHRARVDDKRRRRTHDQQIKPLESYRDEELARCHECFFGPDPAYHEARRRFDYKLPHRDTAGPAVAAARGRQPTTHGGGGSRPAADHPLASLEVATSNTAAVGRGPGLLVRAPSSGLVLGAIASVQFGAAIAATLFARVGPAGAVLLRLVAATIALLAVWRPRVRGRTRAEFRLAAIFGLVLGFMNLSFYEAIHRIPLGVAVTLEFVGPLTVALAGSRRLLDLLWVMLAAAGIVALTNGGVSHLNGLGVALALTAGALWAAYILVNARVGQAFEGGAGLALAMCVATVVIAPLGLIQGGAHLLAARSLLLGAAVGLLSSAIPYSFELEALRRIKPSVFGVLMSVEPAMAALAGFIVLGQSLGARALIGVGLVVTASVGAARHTPEAPVAV
jgi:inner membrane transporter RhtA